MAPDRPVDEVEVRLAARIAAGDDLALGTLYDRYGSMVYAIARRVTGSASAAEDVTQDAFATVWENIERFDVQRGSLRAFLSTIGYRQAVDWVRREAAAARRVARAAAAKPVEQIDGAAFDLCATMREALGGLPLEQRRAVFLAYYEGLTYREVAARLGLPEGTVKSRLRLALARLRASLDEGGRDRER